jgi:hypothetical protein
MKFDLSCKDVTHLVLEAEDRALNLRERLAVRFHLAICVLCPPFVRQVRFMRSAMGRWKDYAEHEPPEA